MPSWFNLPFGKQNKMRRDFIINELKKRGYDTIVTTSFFMCNVV